MDQDKVIQILESNGFQSRKLDDCIIYEQYVPDDLDVVINGVDLYVSKCNYVKFEADKWGLCVRLYHGYTYIGCITNSWEDIKSFRIEDFK